jgi:hypothetical protein
MLLRYGQEVEEEKMKVGGSAILFIRRLCAISSSMCGCGDHGGQGPHRVADQQPGAVQWEGGGGLLCLTSTPSAATRSRSHLPSHPCPSTAISSAFDSVDLRKARARNNSKKER